MSAQVGHNEQRQLHSRTAAESGMEWTRYQLLQVPIPPFTPDNQLLEVVYKDFTNRLEMTGNLGSNLVYINPGGTQVEVPEKKDAYISLYAKGPRFRIQITRSGRDLLVTSIGSPGESGPGVRSGVKLTFRATQERGTFYERGMSSMGGVSIKTGSIITADPPEYASIYALGPVTLGPGTSTAPTGIAGDLYVPAGTTPTIGAYTYVDGVSDPNVIRDATLPEELAHTHYLSLEERPEYPTVDTSIFAKFATNPYLPFQTEYVNVKVLPGTNPVFNGPCSIKGVLYIQQPNYVTFAGNVTMQCIVATDPYDSSLLKNSSLATNVLEFTGSGGSKLSVASLPPGDSRFDGIRELTGSFIVAPKFDVKITGNFGTTIGDICGDRVSIGGSSAVNISGSIFTLSNAALTISGNASVSLKPNPNSLHSGIQHWGSFHALPSTWTEVTLP
jgi:hypothetical protein